MSIKIENLNHIYMPGSPYEKHALKNINLEIIKGEFVGIIGSTGSGKSTLVQHLNGLLKPTSGKIYIDNVDITLKNTDIKEIRKKVGMVFQYPEHQLFEETVYKDIAFGPLNMGFSEAQCNNIIHKVLKIVGLNEEILNKSPFELSGGQKRRVAIAGVLAMEPNIIILDEPTAGLDPSGRDEILFAIKDLHKKYNITVILVSHSMEDVARFVQKVVVMHDGTIVMTDIPSKVFENVEKLEKIGLTVPQITHVMNKLKNRGLSVNTGIYTVHQAKRELIRLFKEYKVKKSEDTKC